MNFGATSGSNTIPENVYWTLRVLLLIAGVAVWWVVLSTLARQYNIDTRRRGARERSWSIRELFPGPTGRRARVERHHLEIMSRDYAHKRELRVRRRRIFPIRLHRHIKK